MSDIIKEFTISLEQVKDYEFLVKFDDLPEALLMDAPPGVGRNAGPCPTQILAAAVGNCLTMTLVLFARKAGLQPTHVRAAVKARLVRGENGLPRMGAIDVSLEPGFAEADQPRAAACLKAFESYCAVTESVRAGIDVRVAVSQQASAGN
jgi:organic hydroperoxide reductase OsmC/OhrA